LTTGEGPQPGKRTGRHVLKLQSASPDVGGFQKRRKKPAKEKPLKLDAETERVPKKAGKSILGLESKKRMGKGERVWNKKAGSSKGGKRKDLKPLQLWDNGKKGVRQGEGDEKKPSWEHQEKKRFNLLFVDSPGTSEEKPYAGTRNRGSKGGDQQSGHTTNATGGHTAKQRGVLQRRVDSDA